MATSQDYLLLFIAAPSGKYSLDRIRVMKGMFLLTEEAPSGVATGYKFEAYDWGPFSQAVYQDLDRLEAQGLIAVDGLRGRYETYRVTGVGQRRAGELEHADSIAAQKIRELKELTTSMSFLDLLEYVYDRHPSYTHRSKLRR